MVADPLDIWNQPVRFPKPTDPDFFAPGSYAIAVIKQDAEGFFAQAERGSHKGPILARAKHLRGMFIDLYAKGWRRDSVELDVPIPLSEIPEIEATEVPAALQEHPALTITDFEEKLCRACRWADPEDQEPIRTAFAEYRKNRAKGIIEYSDIDSTINLLSAQGLLKEFSVTEICQIRHSCITMKDHAFEAVVRSEIAPLILERIRLSAWHNHFTQLTWDEIARVHNSLRSFTVGLPGFSVAFDHTTGCNDRGYTEYFSENRDGQHHRVYADGELVYFISYKGKPVLVISFNVFKASKNSAPGIFIRQLQLLHKTGNRWLFHLPCHYFEFFMNRMHAAFSRHQLYLVRGDVIGEVITKGYESTVKENERIIARKREGLCHYKLDPKDVERIKGEIEQYQRESAVFREKIARMRGEVITRLKRNYGRPATSYRMRKDGDYWKLDFPKAHDSQNCDRRGIKRTIMAA